MRGQRSESGVFVYDDYRDNLIIDQSDPILAAQPEPKRTALRSEHSAQALTWNVFRTLRRLQPADWFRLLSQRAFGRAVDPGGQVRVELWQPLPPAPAGEGEDEPNTKRVESGSRIRGFSGLGEADVIIRAPRLVWTIAVTYKSDLSLDPGRKQILRHIDAGSAYAREQGRDFYFSLLLLDATAPTLLRDASERERLLAELPHPDDGPADQKALGVLTCSDLARVLHHCATEAWKGADRSLAETAVEWLATRGIAPR